MRLTLRTMLAYLDDVLSEADAHELGQKIESSDFASGLVHRIRNSISRLRLSSPDLLGNDSMDDPNTVAEFIDSALSPEREQEFEKVCLQSDKHLSEVASCHQILTMVLGTPARVEPRLRDRIYRTGIPGEGAATPVPVGTDGRREAFRVDEGESGPQEVAIEIQRPRPLSDSNPNLADFGKRRNLWPIAAAVLIGFLLTGGFMIAMGPLDSGHPMAGLLGLSDDAVAMNDPDDDPSPDAALTGPESTSSAATSEPIALPTTQSPSSFSAKDQQHQPAAFTSEVPPVVAPEVPSSPAVDSPWVMPELSGDSETSPLVQDEVPLGTGPDNNSPVADDGGLNALPTDSTSAPAEALATVSNDEVPGIRDPFARDSLDDQPTASLDAPLDTDPHEPPMPNEGIGIPGLADTPLSDPPVNGDDTPGEAVAVSESPDSVEPTQDSAEQPLLEVGRFFSDDQVLLYWDEQVAAWLRMPPRTAFSVGHRLRSLQNYRPQLLLAPGNIQLTVRGNSEIIFSEPLDAQTPMVEVPFGRFLLNSTGREDARVALRTGQRSVEVSFLEPNTEIICQVRSILLPGLDPRQEPPHRLVQLWVTRGSARIVEQDVEHQVDLGNQYAFADDVPARIMRFDKVPGWLHSRVGEVDRDAAAELETLLPLGRDVVLSLTEAAGNRRTDVRSLAIRCLVTLQQYRNGVSLFSVADRKHQLTWPALFDELRDAISHGQESARAVHDTFENLYGRDGERLYEMLVGFNEEQLLAGAAEQMVSDLDHPRVEFRIMAIQNLQRMTGKTLLYGPVQSEKHRSSKITRWRNELKKGKVTFSKPPEDLAQWRQLSGPS